MKRQNRNQFPYAKLSSLAVFVSFLIPGLAMGAPAISSVSTPTKIEKYGKFEITFNITGTTAQNFQLPYDPAPPAGIDPGYANYQGISVDAEFTPDNWQTVYRQPAFYYRYYQEEGVKPSWNGNMHEWYYPTGAAAWKVRFSPHQPGTWEFRIKVSEKNGSSISGNYSFTVTPSDAKGFIRVSKKDPRYFEFDDDTLFLTPGIETEGSLADPIKDNELEFADLAKNHINLLRTWISGLYGAAWPKWIGGRNIYDGYLPRPGILPFHDPNQNRDFMTLYLTYPEEWFDACRFEFWENPEAVKPNTQYKLSIKYWGQYIQGPRNLESSNFGLVGKISESWCSDCYEPGTGSAVTNYGHNTSDLNTIEGIWFSGNHNFLPRVYIALENVTEGTANILSVSLREVLAGGQLGPEIMRQPSMEYELYFPESGLFAMDKYIELAQKYGMYLKLVLMDKNDQIYYKLDDDGTFVINGEPDNQDGFYGLGRDMNKTRWLQQSWWRYLQARWGYSTNIHSWELTNEGDPFLTKHWEMADELGKFAHCQVFGVTMGNGDGESCSLQHPNRHLVTTSFWQDFPGFSNQSNDGFWGSPKYPNVDYADAHAYVSTSPAPLEDKLLMERDAAYYHLWHSSKYGGWKFQFPIVRGEAGMVPHDGSTDDLSGLGIQNDTQGIWYHNFVWSSLDAGALYEIYWYAIPHIYQSGVYDHRPIALAFNNFIQSIPLNNGYYEDIVPTVSDEAIRAVGQKDLVAGNAHLWIQNKNHTWKNVIDSVNIAPLTGSVKIDGFTAGQTYTLEWWDPYSTTATQAFFLETLNADFKGTLTIPVRSLASDSAVKVTAGLAPPTNLRIIQ